MLKDNVAIVTGATRGLGFEISKQFAKRGATIIMCSRSTARAENSASRIGGKRYPARLELTNPQGVVEFMRCVAERHKHLDILINNAGYPLDGMVWNKRLHQVAEEALEKIIDTNLKGTFRLSQAAIPHMIRNVSSTRGMGAVKINIASIPGIEGYMPGAPHGIAKFGVISITMHTALEYEDKNIRAYTLDLGNISFEATFASMTVTERKKAAMENWMKRWGDPSEVATIAASMASEYFTFATRNTIVIDGDVVLL